MTTRASRRIGRPVQKRPAPGRTVTPARARAHAVGSVLATAAALLLATVAFAQTYTVQVNATLNDLDIKVEHVAQSTMLIMTLTNNTDTRVRCNLRYDAAPQTPRRSTVFVNPDRTEQNVFRAQRRWFSVTVNVECSPAPR